MPKKSGKLSISDPKQLNQLSSPVKQLIIDAFKSAREPCTIKSIAERINRAPDSLYYHFRALVKVGLIVQSGTQIEMGKPVALYRPAAKHMKIKYDLGIPGFREIICRIFTAAMRLATRDFQKGVELPNVRGESNTRNLYVCRMEAWLSKRDLREINRRMDEIVEIMSENCDVSDGERCTLFMAIAPQPIHPSNQS